MSRWFVGSSMTRKSASCSSIEAMAARLASPPDSSPMRWSRRVRCSDESTCRTRCSAFHHPPASIAAIARSMRPRSSAAHARSYSLMIRPASPMREYTSSKSVRAGSKSVCWSRNATRMSRMNRTSPPRSDESIPARIFSSELLPVPLGAMRAILSPSLMLKLMLRKSTRSPYDLLRFSA